jgi:hypothetical protein
MRRALVVLTIVMAAGVAVVPPAAAAAPGKGLNREVTGAFSGTSRWAFGEGCAFVHEVFDGTFSPSSRKPSGTYHFDTCVAPANALFTVRGTFTIDTGRGDRLSGQLSGDLDATLIVTPIDWTLTVTSGTGRFRKASGTIEVIGTLDFIEMLSFRTVDQGRFEASL